MLTSIPLKDFIKKSVNDEYVMTVFYNLMKKSYIERKLSSHTESSIYIDGRFLGVPRNVTFRLKGDIHLQVVSLLLSTRLLMLNHSYISYCENNHLLLSSELAKPFQWIGNTSLILDNWEDMDVRLLFSMLRSCFYEGKPSDTLINDLKETICVPEYKNITLYYQYAAKSGIDNSVIRNFAFVDNPFVRYTVRSHIAYVGNVAFAYCNALKIIEFEGKVQFGAFPIVECENLKKIVVPEELLTYYKECLPHYTEIITTKSQINGIERKKQSPITETEYVNRSIVSSENAKSIAQSTEKNVYDIKLLESVFNKAANSYKFFWLISIISLVKEKGTYCITYKDLLVRMVTIAWPIVYEDNINLGNQDKLTICLNEISKKTFLFKGASRAIVDSHLSKYYETQGVYKILETILNEVKIHSLSPWFKDSSNTNVIEESRSKDFDGLYAIFPNEIVIDEDWGEYIKNNYEEVCKFVLKSFVSFAKKFNDDIRLIKLMTTGWRL